MKESIAEPDHALVFDAIVAEIQLLQNRVFLEKLGKVLGTITRQLVAASSQHAS